MALARSSYPARGTRNTSHPIEVLAVPRQRVRRCDRSALKFFGRLLTAVVNGSDEESELESDSTPLRNERLLTTCHALSRALSPEHHSKGLDLVRCSLCGSRCSPEGTHVCPRLYGR